METFDAETFELKFRIADVATDLYIEGDGNFLIKNIAKEIGIDPAEIFNYFPNKKSILKFYYSSLTIRYEIMIDEIDEFQSYTLSEKFSNLAFASFDMLQEKTPFVKDTFEEIILNSFTKTDYEKEIERICKRFIEHDPRVTMSSTFVINSYFYAFLRRQFTELVRFWINDSSDGQELTMELTDKLTNILQELLYNAILDKSFDLAKFLVTNRKKFLNNIPIVKEFNSKIEIR